MAERPDSRDEAAPRRPRYVLGITGTIASGKDECGKVLSDNGVPIIDTDKLGHQLLNGPCDAYDQVLNRFGDDLVDAPGGPVVRDRLAAIVFNDDEALCDLSKIMIPRIKALLDERLAELADHDIVAVLVPLLHEKGMKASFDEVWCVFVEDEILIQRLMARESADREFAEKLIAAQWPQSEKKRLSDYVLDNSGSRDDLRAQVEALLVDARQRAESKSDAPPADDAPDPQPPMDDANAHYQELLRLFGREGVEEAVRKMDNVATTGHKRTAATVRMTVSETGDGEPVSRDLEVKVTMSARNSGTAGDGDGCSCGCGPECRASCACQSDCGCSCKKPAPVPQPDEGRERSWFQRPGWLLGLLALLAFLAFLAFLAYRAALVEPTHTHVPGEESKPVVIINNPPCCAADEVDKPDDGVVFVPPAPPSDSEEETDPVTSCGVGTRVLDRMPGYAFRFTHNVVVPRIGTWEETRTCDGDHHHRTVLRGIEPSGRLVVHQEFDSHDWLDFQWVVTYGPERGYVQIDRFQTEHNTFVGRTIYRYNQYGTIDTAEHYDGMRRPIVSATLYRSGRTNPAAAVQVVEYDPRTSAELRKYTVSGVPESHNFLTGRFYVFDWFKAR